MKPQTIKQRVAEILEQKGEIDNFYCIDNKITTRLSDVIFRLQREGWVFDDDKSGYLGDSKNWNYVVKPIVHTLRPSYLKKKLQERLQGKLELK